jgi:hypothetical protein
MGSNSNYSDAHVVLQKSLAASSNAGGKKP